ncbi:MAG: LuxR C-terminal-related transcriptional regulator [Aquabacterium sp.]
MRMRLYGAEPDIALVLLDLNMADCKGLQGLRQFVEAYPAARVAVIERHARRVCHRPSEGHGRRGLPAQGLFALADALEHRRHAHRIPRTTAAVLRRRAASGATRFPRAPSASSYDRVAELGPRHLEILELVLSGCSNQEISNSTKLSLGTVKNYVSTILLALDVKSRSHLISLFR